MCARNEAGAADGVDAEEEVEVENGDVRRELCFRFFGLLLIAMAARHERANCVDEAERNDMIQCNTLKFCRMGRFFQCQKDC